MIFVRVGNVANFGTVLSPHLKTLNVIHTKNIDYLTLDSIFCHSKISEPCPSALPELSAGEMGSILLMSSIGF